MAIKLVEFHNPFDTTKDKKIFVECARKPPLTPKKNRHNLIVSPHKISIDFDQENAIDTKLKNNKASQNEHSLLAIAYSVM